MKKRMISLVLALAMCLSLAVPAWAGEPTAKTHYYEVTAEGLREVSKITAATLERKGKDITAIPVNKSLVDGKITTSVDLTDIKTTEDSLQMADSILALAGFSEAEINGMETFEKNNIVGGQELTTVRAVAKASDSVTNQKNSWSSTLSYTRHSMNKYYVTVTAEGMGASFKWANLLCVQGFALDYSSASFHKYYWITKADGTRLRLVSEVLRYSDDPDAFDMPKESTLGSGIGISFKVSGANYVETTSSFFRLGTFAENSSVNLPDTAPGSIGGSFVVYGNTSLISGGTPKISFSYPWSINVSGLGVSSIPCKNSLLARLYR